MSEYKANNQFDKLKVSKAIYPIIIGLAVVGYLFYKDFNPEVFSSAHFSIKSVFWIIIAFFCMFGRDLGYIIRIRILSNNQLTWLQSFRIIMLWEFTSAVTPSAIGGTSFAILYVNKEGITLGKSSAIVLLTSFLDELYFILMFPLLIWFVGKTELFNLTITSQEGILSWGLITIAIIGYSLKLAYILIVSYGLFINPKSLKFLILKVFRLRFLRRWYRSAHKVGNDIIESSNEIKGYGFKFWMNAILATFLSWSSRYLVANALIMAFFGVSDQLLLFARQLVIWIMMLVMPTPGGSGFAEYIFTKFCGDLITVPVPMQLAAATLIALLWRFVTYYPYLIIGAVMLPKWIARNFTKKKTF